MTNQKIWTIWNQCWKGSYGYLSVATFEMMTDAIFWNVQSEQFGTSIGSTQQSFLSNLLAFGHRLPFCPFVLWPMECDSFCLNRCFVSLKQSCAPSELVSMHQPSTLTSWTNVWSEQFGTSFGREVMDFFELPHLKRWPIRYFETTYEVNNLEPVLEAKLWISLSCHIWNDDQSDILKCTKWTIWKRSYGFLRVATFETITDPIFCNVRRTTQNRCWKGSVRFLQV